MNAIGLWAQRVEIPVGSNRGDHVEARGSEPFQHGGEDVEVAVEDRPERDVSSRGWRQIRKPRRVLRAGEALDRLRPDRQPPLDLVDGSDLEARGARVQVQRSVNPTVARVKAGRLPVPADRSAREVGNRGLEQRPDTLGGIRNPGARRGDRAGELGDLARVRLAEPRALAPTT